MKETTAVCAEKEKGPFPSAMAGLEKKAALNCGKGERGKD